MQKAFELAGRCSCEQIWCLQARPMYMLVLVVSFKDAEQCLVHLLSTIPWRLYAFAETFFWASGQ